MASNPSPYSAHAFVVGGDNNSWSNMYHYISEGSRVLDVGCSVGNFGAALQELKGCSVVGIDISADDIEIAKGRLDAAFVLDITDDQDVQQLGTFDVIVCADVLEHLPDARAALRTIKELMRPNAILVFSIPNMAHASIRFDLLGGRFGYGEMGLLDRTHLHFFDRLELENMFSEAGFAITDERPSVVKYPPRMVEERMAEYGADVGADFYEMLARTEAEIFQYVGVAVPISEGGQTPPRAGFVNPADDVAAYAQGVIVENERLAQRVAELESYTRTLDSELRAAQERLAVIRSHPIRTAASAAARRLRRHR